MEEVLAHSGYGVLKVGYGGCLHRQLVTMKMQANMMMKNAEDENRCIAFFGPANSPMRSSHF